MADELHPVRTLKESRINGRGVWLYAISTTIGELFVVEHEQPGLELRTDGLFHNDRDKAEKTYAKALKSMLKEA